MARLSSWDRSPAPRRNPIAEYIEWKNAGGITSGPIINKPILTHDKGKRIYDAAPSFIKGNQLLMFYPDNRPLSVVPTYSRHVLTDDHQPSRIFHISSVWNVDTEFDAAYTLLARVTNFVRDPSSGDVVGARKGNFTAATLISRGTRMAYHPEDDTFHSIGEWASAQKTGVPAHRTIYRFREAPATAGVIYTANTKRVVLVADFYTAQYDYHHDAAYADNCVLSTKKEFIAALLRIKHGNGKILSRLSDNTVLFIGTKEEALRFINFRSDGERRLYPTAFRRTLKVEDFR